MIYYGDSLFLHLACGHDNIDILKLLIDNFREDININLVDKEESETALFKACVNENVEKIKLLIDNFREDIDINLVDEIWSNLLYLWLVVKIILI